MTNKDKQQLLLKSAMFLQSKKETALSYGWSMIDPVFRAVDVDADDFQALCKGLEKYFRRFCMMRLKSESDFNEMQTALCLAASMASTGDL